MKTIKETINKKTGKRVVTVELDDCESLRVFRRNWHYKLAHPVNDIVAGSQIIDAEMAVWDVVSQEWVV